MTVRRGPKKPGVSKTNTMKNQLVCFGLLVLFLLVYYTGTRKWNAQGLRLGQPLQQKSSTKNLQAFPAALDKQRVADSCRGQGRGDGKLQMKVLITGTAGFIGHATAKAMAKRGDGVVGIDNFNSYYSIPLKRARASDLEEAGVHTVEGDLNDRELLESLFETCSFTHIIHLAAQAGVRYASKDPMAYVHSNLAGTVTLLEVIKDQKPMPVLIYASSSSVYGLNTKTPFSEDDRVDQPASLYAATKKADEMLVHTYFNIHGVSATGLRFFTVYGPMGRPDMAAFSFTKAIVENRPIDIFKGPNDSELKRDFTYIDDIVQGVIGSTDVAPPSSKATAEFRLFNLGNTNPTSVSDFVGLLEKHIGKKAIRNYIPLPPTGDVLATHADITRAKQAFGYEPHTNLDEGLRRFVEWYKKFYIEDKHEY